MSMLKVFKSTIPSVNVALGNGTLCVFVNGRYCTDNEMIIQTLENEVRMKHPHIYIDANEKEIDSELIDPEKAMRHRIIQEYLADQARAMNPDNDMGTSDQSGKVNAANSRDIAPAAIGSSGVILTPIVPEAATINPSAAATLSKLQGIIPVKAGQ